MNYQVDYCYILYKILLYIILFYIYVFCNSSFKIKNKKIGQFEPSPKICNICGYYSKELTLADREWNCPDCKSNHDGGINAAINIKKLALDKQNLIGF